MKMGLLSLAIWTPIVFGAILLAMGRDDQARTVRWIALIGALISFLVTLPLYGQFDIANAGMQFVEKTSWIERFNVNYHLGLDGISFWFVLLTAFITLVVVISAWEVITERVNQYMGAFLILSGFMIGVFCASEDSGSLCQVRMSKLPPDLVYRNTSATSISSEPSSVYRKNLKAA